MFFLKLAARNVLRHYGRTALSMVSVVAGVAVIIFGRGFTGGLRENIIRAQIDTVSGHVLVLPADYPTAGLQHPVDRLLELDSATAAWLDRHSVAWTRRVLFTPQIIRGPDAMRVRAFGFDPARDEAVFPRTGWQVAGRVPRTSEDGVLVGRGVADAFALRPGVSIVLTARTTAGAINALEVPVAGVLTAGNPMIDGVGIFVPMPLTDDLLRCDGRFSHLAVRLDRRDRAAWTAAELRPRFGARAQVRTWMDETGGLVETADLRQAMLDVIAFALVAIAAAGIANTVLMAAYERVREIGTLRAMGMTRRGVLALFIGEGLLMGCVGSVLGALLGGSLVYKLARDGIDISNLVARAGAGGTYSNMPFSTVLYASFSWTVILVATLFGVLIAALSSIYPAVLASRRQPADAVRADG
jgi:putative ABC transport system permease protein